MTNIELNKEMHRILGLFWHETIKDLVVKNGRIINTEKCSCGHKAAYLIHKDHWEKNLNFFGDEKWRAFGMAWEWLQKHERWEEFFDKWGYYDTVKYYLYLELINPRDLAKAIVEFFKEDKP